MEQGNSSVFSHPLCSSRFTNLVRLVSRYGCEGRFLPRLLGIGLMSLLRQPGMLYESLRQGSRISAQSLHPEPVFIIGHWRSGTTHLQNILSTDPQFAKVTLRQAAMPLDFLTIGGLLSGPMGKALPRKRLMDNMAVSVDCPWEEELALVSLSPLSFYHVSFFPKAVGRIFRESILFNDGEATLLEQWTADYLWFLKKVQMVDPAKPLLLKNPANSARIRYLVTLFPKARYIHIHRDPYRVFASTVHLYQKAQEAWGLHRADRQQIVDHVLKAYPQLMDGWLAQRQLVPEGQLVEVRFSDLQSKPLDTLRSIYDGLDLPDFARAEPRFREYLDSVRSYRKNILDLSADEKHRVQEEWSRFFDRLGYEK